METLIATKQKIQLVDGTFTPSEANDVIQALLDEKINFHKLNAYHGVRVMEMPIPNIRMKG